LPKRLKEIYGEPVELEEEFRSSDFPAIFSPDVDQSQNHLRKSAGVGKALAAVERILLLFPDVPMELRDRGLIHYQLGHWTTAGEDLENYLLKVPTASDAPKIRLLLNLLGENLKTIAPLPHRLSRRN
jgi:regulator of sirC expression with transglutaminase-like and TPR domain